MKQRIAIQVKGNNREWIFTVKSDPENIEIWRDDGVNVIGVIQYSCPQWVMQYGLSPIWFFVQNIWSHIRLW